jgi:hypothetical protein
MPKVGHGPRGSATANCRAGRIVYKRVPDRLQRFVYIGETATPLEAANERER